ALEGKVAWLRQLLESEGNDFIDRFQDEIFEDRVYVLTPRGGVIDLPAGATPDDFAYHVHTEIGHRCRGAKVNGRIVPLNHALRTGDRVEIITAKQGEPSRDWLNPQAGYARSSRARDKIRYWFRQQSREENVARGKAALERELSRLDLRDVTGEELARQFRLADVETLWLAIGAGDISPVQITNALQRLKSVPDLPPVLPLRRASAPPRDDAMRIAGVDQLLTKFARCCQPVPPDPIRGYVTRGRGVSVHRADCPHLLLLAGREPNRIVTVE